MPKIDELFGKWSSRKLMVWSTSTLMLYFGQINGDQWVALSLAYVGVQGFADLAIAYKHGK